MEGLEATAAATAATTTEPAVAPVAPVATSATTAPATPDASLAPESAGSQNNPVVVPRGTQEKFKELEAGGYKPEAIEAYLATIPDESTRQLVKDSLDGKQIYLKEGGIDMDAVDPFLPEELDNLEELVKDPELVAARIKKMTEEFLALNEELEQAKNAVPEPMQRILQHPMVKLAVQEMERGEVPALKSFDSDTYKAYAAQLIESGDPEALKQFVEHTASEVEVMLANAVAVTRDEMEREADMKVAVAKAEADLQAGLMKVDALPEFKTSIPAKLPDGSLNPSHPGIAFSYWLYEGLASGEMTMAGVERLGGIDKVALGWLSNQRGGMGKMIADARNQSAMSFRAKLLQGKRDGSLAGSTAKTLTVPTGGVATPLLHGVDINLASQGTPSGNAYAANAMRGLNDAQLKEVADAIRRKSGMA